MGTRSWKPVNDITGISRPERHNETNEPFVLVRGNCALIYTNEVEGRLVFGTVKMERDKVYSISSVPWHNTVTQKDTKMILIEDSSTSMKNSDILNLDAAQVEEMRSFWNR